MVSDPPWKITTARDLQSNVRVIDNDPNCDLRRESHGKNHVWTFERVFRCKIHVHPLQINIHAVAAQTNAPERAKVKPKYVKVPQVTRLSWAYGRILRCKIHFHAFELLFR